MAHMRDSRGTYRFWWWDLRERHHLEDLGTDGGIILKYIFNKWKEEREGHGLD